MASGLRYLNVRQIGHKTNIQIKSMGIDANSMISSEVSDCFNDVSRLLYISVYHYVKGKCLLIKKAMGVTLQLCSSVAIAYIIYVVELGYCNKFNDRKQFDL